MAGNKMRGEKGSVLAEFIIVMPILVFMIFGTIQISMVWMARLMTRYAAYRAARTAIVYNPLDYKDKSNSGPVHRAACIVLAWTGMSNGSATNIAVPGWGNIPGSIDIAQQVSVEVEEVKSENGQNKLPAVKAIVTFHYPLVVPYAGSLIAHFANDNDDKGKWDLVHYKIDGEPKKNDFNGSHEIDMHKGKPGNYITLTESCIMPQPWDTNSYPLASERDNTLVWQEGN